MSGKLISKSNYIKSKQCKKAFYLAITHPEEKEKPNKARKALFRRGHNIGKLAWGLFPGGLDLSPGNPINLYTSAKKTAAAIARGEEILYEATFIFRNFVCIADILVKKNDQWHLFEVKSSARIQEYHKDDISFQYFVIANAGLKLCSASIGCINSNYKRDKDLDLNKLFQAEDGTREIVRKVKHLEQDSKALLELIQLRRLPTVPIGAHCFKPFACDFLTFCAKEAGGEHIINNSLLDANTRKNLIVSGLENSNEIESENLPKQFDVQIKSSLQNEEYYNRLVMKRFLSEIPEQFVAIDFETLSAAVPPMPGIKPFQSVPFALSITYWDKSGEFLTDVYVVPPGEEPYSNLMEFIVEKLLPLIENSKVLVFDQQMEKKILGVLANKFPDYASEISKLKASIIDIRKPLAQNWYYNPEMKGSYSRKALASAVASNFDDSIEIDDGILAALEYEYLLSYDMEEEERMSVLESIRQYAFQDTAVIPEIIDHWRSLNV